MHSIEVENIRIYAYHGCLPEEAKIGSEYRCDLWIDANLSTSAHSDLLADTVDYVSLTAIAKEEMAIRAALLEHVARRIAERIMGEHALVQNVKVRVAKLCPPIEADVQSVAVHWTMTR
jgi:dihydroneopterin aldolase